MASVPTIKPTFARKSQDIQNVDSSGKSSHGKAKKHNALHEPEEVAAITAQITMAGKGGDVAGRHEFS